MVRILLYELNLKKGRFVFSVVFTGRYSCVISIAVDLHFTSMYNLARLLHSDGLRSDFFMSGCTQALFKHSGMQPMAKELNYWEQTRSSYIYLPYRQIWQPPGTFKVRHSDRELIPRWSRENKYKNHFFILLTQVPHKANTLTAITTGYSQTRCLLHRAPAEMLR